MERGVEPMPLPVREPAWRPVAERLGERLGYYSCRARSQSQQIGVYLRSVRTRTRRWQELLRAARTAEGRQRNVVPLLVLATAAGFLLGAGTGLLRK